MTFIYAKGISDEERQQYARIVRDNTLQSMQVRSMPVILRTA
jgi:hypothetical protein